MRTNFDWSEIIDNPNTKNVVGFEFTDRKDFLQKMRDKYGDTELVAKKIGINMKIVQRAHREDGIKNQFNNSIKGRIEKIGQDRVKHMTVEFLVRLLAADPRNIKNILRKLKWDCIDSKRMC